jgi:YHS domain-containing protein
VDDELEDPMMRDALTALTIAVVVALPAVSAEAADPINTTLFGDVAIKGYDPVAYFADARPVKGSKDHELEWNGATWRFASEDHLAAFEAEPERYAPQYGGYCAWAVSQGYTANIDPEAWRIVEDRLYLNYSKEVQRTWETDIPGHIAAADANWPGVLDD